MNSINSKIIISREELKRRQSFDLKEKIVWTIERYLDYLEVYHETGVYISFSGGKDSQVLKDIIDRLHNGEFIEFLKNEYLFLYNKLVKNNETPPSVFCDTGLEFPEIRKHVKKFKNVVWLKPKQLWTDVVLNIGFLIGSKKTSRMIQDIRNPKETNQKSRTLYLTGVKSDGTETKSFKLAKSWKPLIKAPFQVSGKCCDIFKKEPFKIYEKVTKRKPISATTTDEGDMRRISYMQTGCNSFGDKPMSRPLSIWLEKDIWNYHDLMNIKFADVYYSREVEFFENDGTLTKITVDGEKRTGCIFCLIGTPKQIEQRFDRLKKTHQKQYNFLMDGKINMRQVFEFIGIKSKLF